jgi:hypothetical protein
MRYHHFALLIGVLGLITAGCDLGAEDDDTSGVVSLSGQVLDVETNNPVPAAFVRVLPFDLLFEADAEGNYGFDLEVDSTMELRLVATRNGYGDASTEVLAMAGRQIKVPTLRIHKSGAEELESGSASNILLLDQSSQSIGVKESGSSEVATLTFQLADSLGRPVILDNAADVSFSLGVQPGGGEFIYPTSSRTDNNGRATVNLSSGSLAGVVQVVASTTVGGEEIRSLPVSVAIHGGHPDQTHFSLGPEKFNFPGLRHFGIENPISVIVGDEHGNPVKPGTAVYFTTDGGIVEGSVLTDDQGRGSATLISANPLPSDGIGVITASTADKNQQTVSSRTAVVFSGVPYVTVSPSTAMLGQTYTLTVQDQNGNPLVGGTQISVRVEGTKVKAVGNTSVLLDDTAFIGGLTYDHVLRGFGITEFSFRAVEDLILDEEGEPTVESITILVSGPNGSLEIVLGASTGLQTRMISNGEAVIERLDSETSRVRVQL